MKIHEIKSHSWIKFEYFLGNRMGQHFYKPIINLSKT